MAAELMELRTEASQDSKITLSRSETSMLISLDAQKAFDTVKWEFLYGTLTSMGFH